MKERIAKQSSRSKEYYDQNYRTAERKISVNDRIFGPFTVVAVDQYNVHYMDGRKKKIANKDDVRLVNESTTEEAEEAEDPDCSENKDVRRAEGANLRRSSRLAGKQRKV
uniref:Transposon MuDR mudrA n=1 Tax=Caenorhabditis tropicalis TaxID=1561998 RepID=A0A1I7V3Z1_9PELO